MSEAESGGMPTDHSMTEMADFNIKASFIPKITVFHCFNALSSTAGADSSEYVISAVRMPCSSLTREVFLLRAFEAGADAVIVLVCPEGDCRYAEGNIRAGKKVVRIKKILDEIGLDGKRLNIHPVSEKDHNTINRIINRTVSGLAELGPNPAI